MAKTPPEQDDDNAAHRLHAHAQALALLTSVDREIDQCRRAAAAIANTVAACRATSEHVERGLEKQRQRLRSLLAAGADLQLIEHARGEVRATAARHTSMVRSLSAQVRAAKERQAMLRRQVRRLEDRRRAVQAQLPEELTCRYEALRRIPSLDPLGGISEPAATRRRRGDE